MDTEDKRQPSQNSVHKVLAHSYFAFFVFFLVSVCLDLIFHLKVFNSSLISYFGFVFLLLASFLIVWAQMTSRHFKKENISKVSFFQGPYRYTRTPTHLGLFMLMLGFGMVMNAFFIILFSFISFIFTKLTFLVKEEKILTEKYGAPYMEYKELVKF